MVDSSQSASKAGGWWSGLMGGGGANAHPHSGHAHGLHPAVLGLYMFGGVGCGKTMLMDMFVSTAPPEFKVGGGSAGQPPAATR